jgi:ATP-dependent helicase/nuclease subunit B
VPPTIRLVESASAAHRIDAARAFIEGHAPDREILIVGGSRDAADDLARQVVVRRGAGFGLHRFSLVQFAVRLALTNMARAGQAPATPLGSEALAARVVFQALEDGALHYYAPVARFPGFPRALAQTLTELRLAGVSPTELRDRPPGAGAEGDVADLLHRFDEQLAEGCVTDLTGLLDIATRAADDDPPLPLLGNPLVLLDIAITSPAHQAFIAALVAHSPVVLVTLPAGDEETRRALLDIAPHVGGPEAVPGGPVVPNPSPTQTPTETGGAVTPSGLSMPPGLDHRDDLARLQMYLFSPEPPPEEVRRGNVVFFSAPGESRESVEIARLALEEARAGVPFDRMAVLLRFPGAYTPLLETALARASIPAYFAQGTTRPDPAGRAFLTLLDCALDGLSAKRFAEYLAFGQVPPIGPAGRTPAGGPDWTPPGDEALGPAAQSTSESAQEDREVEGGGVAGDDAVLGVPVQDAQASDDTPVLEGGLRAPWKWEELLVESAVIGGHDRWVRRLDGLAAEFDLRLQELQRDSVDSPAARAVERNLRDLEHLRGFALPTIERLAALPHQATWGEWILALEALAPRVLRRPERVLATLADLRPLAPIGPVGLAEVRAVLAPRLQALERPRPSHRYGRLFVGTVEQGRGRTFDVVFVPGLAERVFPQKPREDPILLDDVRRNLTPTLRTQNDRAEHERVLLRLAVGAATRHVYLSYPRVDVDAGRPRVASFYALEVNRAFTGTIPNPETLEREAAAARHIRLAWPAPDVPTYAIDDAEHDLATLHTLLIASGETAKGRARYLLDLNECLARSLRSRYQRWKTRWTPADGLVRATERTQAALSAARPTARGYSVGNLQHFAVCPYRFFLSAILRLEPRQEAAPLERLDPRTRGALVSDVQAEVMRALQAADGLPMSPETLDVAMRLLDETLNRTAEAYREHLAPPILRVWQNDVEAIRVDLRMWLERCVAIQATWEPIAFEFAFGVPAVRGTDPRSVPEEVVTDGGFRLRGIVDLIERRRGAATLRVTDHKTGAARVSAGFVVGGGETLQPVLYALATQRVLGSHVTEARLFYSTRAGQFQERVVEMSAAAALRGREVLEAIDRAVAAGFLPPAPRHDACGICDFRDVCGPHEEQRAARKDPRALRDLNAMRDWP